MNRKPSLVITFSIFFVLSFRVQSRYMQDEEHKVQSRYMQDEEHKGNSRQRRNAIRRDKNKVWNPARIPYFVDSKFPSNIKAAIDESIGLLQQKTCLKFSLMKSHADEKNFIDFVFDTRGSGCGAGIGISHWGKTDVTLSKYCTSVSPVIHEIIHALGFYHEHNRPDALKYVTFNKSNSIPEYSWTLGPYGIDDYGNDDGTLEIIGPYDYRSIMHYNNFGMAAAGSKGFTITNKFAKDMKIGKGYRPTSVDYLKISAYFKCPGLTIDYGSKPGQWGSWSSWTPNDCPKSCGKDYLQRFRWCNRSYQTACLGVSTEVKACDNCAGEKCRDLYDEDFCAGYANCTKEFWVKVCRKHCKYCGKPCTNRMTDYYCLYYAKDFCQEDWAQKECPVTCNACGTKTACENKRKDGYCD